MPLAPSDLSTKQKLSEGQSDGNAGCYLHASFVDGFAGRRG